jgi:hypothetical protein
MANPYDREWLIKESPYICTPVWECTIMLEGEWLQLFQQWNHVQLEHGRIGSGVPGGWGVQPPSKFRSFDKAEPNS